MTVVTDIMDTGMNIRNYQSQDIPEMIRIWNEIVEDGEAFPQEDFLDIESGK